MKKTLLRGIVYAIWMAALMGCAPEMEVGYQPPVIPIRVSINTNGELKVGLSGQVATPVGTFDIGGGATISSIRGKYGQKILVVRLNDDAVAYELEEGKQFDVKFDDSDTTYRKVALTYEDDGDIVLELESAEPVIVYITSVPEGLVSKNASCPGAKYPTRLEAGRAATICTQNDRLIVRRSAGINASELLSLYPDTTIGILEGPVCADDFWWWKVEIYPGTTYGLQENGYNPLGTTNKSYFGWAREGWDNVDPYFICQ